MSRAQRVGLSALAISVAAATFVFARPDDEDNAGEPAQATETAPREPAGPASEPTATTDARPEARVVLRGHRPVGGVRRIEVKKGAFVRLAVSSDARDQIHLHGYDIKGTAGPVEPFRFSFRADVEGVFEIESHEAEHGGGDPLIARLVVSPP